MKTENKFPLHRFNLSPEEYAVLTPENYDSLPAHMKENNLKKLIIISNEEGIGWNDSTLPDLTRFSFIEVLLVYWTNVADISNIHVCSNVKVLWLDNDDRTKLDFSAFPKVERIVTWNRKNVDKVWDIPTLKDLTVAGLKAHEFRAGVALDSLEVLRIIKSSVQDLSFLSRASNIHFLELLSMSKLTNIEFLGTLNTLNYLIIEANKIEDFSIVRKLKNLTSCYIVSKNGRPDMNALKELEKLQDFSFRGNKNMLESNRRLKEFLKDSRK